MSRRVCSRARSVDFYSFERIRTGYWNLSAELLSRQKKISALFSCNSIFVGTISQSRHFQKVTKSSNFERFSFISVNLILTSRWGHFHFLSTQNYGIYTLFQNGPILPFFCLLANQPLMPRSLTGNSKEYFPLNEATGANLQVTRILKWRPFWNKVYGLPSKASSGFLPLLLKLDSEPK